MRGKLIRENLRSGKRVYGTHVLSFGDAFTTSILAELEMDFVFICTEHIPIDRAEVSTMCKFFASHDISPIVRIPYPSTRWAAMVLDGGAQGIVAPYVESVEEVKALAGAVRYRPIKGKFCADLVNGVRQPKDKTKRFLERFNEDRYLIIGVESVEAIDNLETLLSVDGVDAVFLGPHDITVSMEIPEEYDNPHFIDLVTDVIRRCRKLGKGVGIHMDSMQERCKPFFDAGMNWVLNGATIIKTRDRLVDDFRILRSRYGQATDDGLRKEEQTQSCIT